METNSSRVLDSDDSADLNRVNRDYAMMRMEFIESSDLCGFNEQDLKDISDSFHDSQCKLLLAIPPPLRKQELEVTFNFENKVKDVRCRLRELHSDVKGISVSSHENIVTAKLPKINVKPFDGKLENWVSFIQLFDSLIHNRKNLSNVEKLHYLLSSVKDTAYELIKNFPLSDASYIDAYNTLRKYYDRKRQIATYYYEKLLFCEPVKNKSASELERVSRTFTENLSVLEKYNLPDRNFMLFHLLWSKLDKLTREAFQFEYNSDDIPLVREIQDFVEKQYKALEMSNITHQNKQTTGNNNKNKNKSSLIVPQVNGCAMCSVVGHSIKQCVSFLELSPNERFSKVKENRLCILCLLPSHSVKKCKSGGHCDKCKLRHNTLLHFNKPDNLNNINSSTSQPGSQVSLTVPTVDPEVLFSTAVVLIKNKIGKMVRVRMLLDSASACNFITLTCAKRLGLEIKNVSQSVNGIGQVTTNTFGSVCCEIFPTNGDTHNKFSFQSFVLPHICPDMPSGCLDIASWHHLKRLHLADPEFYKSGPIDLLVNVNIFASALKPGLVRGKAGEPIAISTVFGWIVMGECTHNYSTDSCDIHSSVVCSRSNSCVVTKNCFLVSSLSLDNNIKRFWELENVESPKSVVLSKSELSCKNHMEACYCRNPDGRMVVPLTFVNLQDKPWFFNSREIALQRLYNLEKKFKLNPQFQTDYVKFMDDYQTSGHMEVVEAPSSSDGNYYYIPHHGVLRPDSVTTPLRTVFDASAKDAQGKSLNDTLLPGPKMQKNIFDLLIRFRWHAVVFTGDIKQMYRQFLVCEEDRDYQRILWRSSPDESVRDFRLLTVTYGVTCAPYQALWCISKLAEESSSCKQGAAILARDIYVDDVVSGADSIESALQCRQELLKILSSACLHLRKWTSNKSEFFEGLLSSDLYLEQVNFENINDISLKILGLLWMPTTDVFSFKTSTSTGRCTKRSILSDIARIFDPLGLLSPVVFFAKYLMQLLWLSGIDWDDDVPKAISLEWIKFKDQLSMLSSLSIPRRIIEPFINIQFHGFCDASERGYCAVLYCRIILEDKTAVVRLCCAKSKVAPLRRVSIPRLELLAAVLLADLVSSVAFALKDVYCIDKVTAWSDSTVALTWIKSCPSKWKTFVANRTSLIQEKIAPDCWRHVSTNDNPADHGSRGLLPADISRCDSWWAGPSWLSLSEKNWPSQSFVECDSLALDEQKVLTLLTALNLDFIDRLLSRFSTFRRIVNVLTYCFRFLHNLKNPEQKVSGKTLLSEETNSAVHFLVRHVQEQVFPTEIRCIQRGSLNSLPKPIRKLCPFLDKEGLLRVGGRLSHSLDLDFEMKHPLLLPRDHRLTLLIIEEYHRRFMHPGLQTLQNLLVQEFWILSPKRAIRSVIASCVKCFRANPRVAPTPLMGDLPAFRISQLKPFSSSAVDYAGPFNIALGRARGSRTYKGYVCVFVCTATKAVHLELVSELTSEAYLAALRRFISRRGRCSRLVSDQGRNFVGASNILKELMIGASEVEQIEFVFNPPGSPHFSGLAEAGVKSVKTHLCRVVGLQRLTFEEFYTFLTQIEAMLNSRPLSPLSSDPKDLSVLTPGHFLTLEPLTILPESNLVDLKISPINRWKLIQQMHQDFWKRWHSEYLHTLQQRHKWSEKNPNLDVGSMVLIVNEPCNPLKWSLGRVVQLHPGADGVCRVVTVHTANGEYKRPVVKLCLLPLSN